MSLQNATGGETDIALYCTVGYRLFSVTVIVRIMTKVRLSGHLDSSPPAEKVLLYVCATSV